MNILAKLTNKWKTIGGVIAVATLQSLFDTNIISEWWFSFLTPYAYGLGAIGLTHKVQKFIDKKGT